MITHEDLLTTHRTLHALIAAGEIQREERAAAGVLATWLDCRLNPTTRGARRKERRGLIDRTARPRHSRQMGDPLAERAQEAGYNITGNVIRSRLLLLTTHDAVLRHLLQRGTPVVWAAHDVLAGVMSPAALTHRLAGEYAMLATSGYWERAKELISAATFAPLPMETVESLLLHSQTGRAELGWVRERFHDRAVERLRREVVLSPQTINRWSARLK